MSMSCNKYVQLAALVLSYYVYAKGMRRQHQFTQLFEYLLQILLYFQMQLWKVQMHVGIQSLPKFNSNIKFKFEQKIRHLFIIAGLLVVILRGQEVLVQDLPAGAYRGIREQNRAVPRYYLCGAGVEEDRNDQPATEMLKIFLKKIKNRFCNWVPKCVPVTPTLLWARINGIRFDYCHFQNWHTKIFQEENGSWEWQGMQMCPENMYVYGFKSKLTERDGMAGLVLQCRSLKAQDIKQIVVFEGEGSWRYRVLSSDPSVGFKANYLQGYINGLSMQMAAVPYIFSFNLNYTFPANSIQPYLKQKIKQSQTTDQLY